MVYQFVVEIPTKLSSKERDMLQALAKESGVNVGDGKRGHLQPPQALAGDTPGSRRRRFG